MWVCGCVGVWVCVCVCVWLCLCLCGVECGWVGGFEEVLFLFLSK